eukprot:14582692-Ditylum_brightwellii.AAC.1
MKNIDFVLVSVIRVDLKKSGCERTSSCRMRKHFRTNGTHTDIAHPARFSLCSLRSVLHGCDEQAGYP